MNETHMRSLVSVVDQGSINAAARELFITAPSLHQRLGVLEAEIGCPLLERGARGITPTEAGRRLYQACRICIDELDAARHDIALMTKQSHSVCIGSDWRPSLQAYYAIEALHETMPALNVSTLKVDKKSLADALADGDIDVYESPRLVDTPQINSLMFHRYGFDRYLVLCGPESQLASRDIVTVDMLSDMTIYAGFDYRTFYSYKDDKTVGQLCSWSNFMARYFSTEKIVSDCMNGSAVVLFTAVRAGDLCPPLTAVPFDFPPLETGAYTRATPSPATLAVVEALREQWLAHSLR